MEATSNGGYPPVEIRGTGRLGGGSVTVDSSVSSQFASALLMVAPLADEPVELRLEGPVVSRSYLDGTVEMMRAFGGDVNVDGDTFIVSPGGYAKAHVEIEPDASAAVYPAVAAAVTGGTVDIPGLPPDSTQPDLAILAVLSEMGCAVSRGLDGVRVEGAAAGLRGVATDLSSAPDGAMAVAVAAALAEGPSELRGLSTLRHKETDRLAALEKELTKIGAEIRVEGDTLFITPGAPRAATIETYGDHRMAMSMALAGLVVSGIEISEPGVVSKTWPGYFDMLAAL